MSGEAAAQHRQLGAGVLDGDREVLGDRGDVRQGCAEVVFTALDFDRIALAVVFGYVEALLEAAFAVGAVIASAGNDAKSGRLKREGVKGQAEPKQDADKPRIHKTSERSLNPGGTLSIGQACGKGIP